MLLKRNVKITLPILDMKMNQMEALLSAFKMKVRKNRRKEQINIQWMKEGKK